VLTDLVDGNAGRFMVIIEALLGEFGVRIEPRDDKNTVTLIGRPLNERVLFPQVQDIVLVDPRREDKL